MPKRKSTKQENGNAFQLWWNERFFHKEPFYENYKKLRALGADLDYIEFLRELFVRGEDIVKTILDEQIKEKRWKDSKREKWALSGRDNYIRDAVNLTIEAIEEKGLPSTEGETKRIQEEVVHLIKHDDYLWLSRLVPARNVSASFSEIRSRLGTDNLIILKYIYPDSPGRKGADKWGDFFLVALTEHLRESTKKPRYLEAHRLLLKLRREICGAARGDRDKCKQRVFRFKKDFPRWKRDLNLLTNLRSQISSS